MSLQILTTSEPGKWTQAVEQCPNHDLYHLVQYHALAEDAGGGKALLFHHSEGAYSVSLPLLLRTIDGLPGGRADLAHLNDATSVYGYPGPVASHTDIPDAVIRNFQTSLQDSLRDMGVVTAFSRLHPVLSQHHLLQGIGECRKLSRTVSIDLTLPADVQRAAFRKSHKDGINKLRRQGVITVHDREGKYLDDFIAIYYETMRRVGALPDYFFPPAYFHGLFELLGDRAHLVICLDEGKPVSGGIFFECGGIVQYHLGGTIDAALKLAPMKLIHDDVRLWAIERGATAYHLGGGATAQSDDSLLHFKRGFSDRTHDFSVWKWVLLGDIYRRLCQETSRWNERNGLTANAGFFPGYRAPAMPSARPASGGMNPESVCPGPERSQGACS